MPSISLRRSAPLLLAFAICLAATTPAPAKTAHAPVSHMRDSELGIAMRKLWQDHVLWTRLVIVSTAAGLPDLDPTTQRLLRNQTEIGDAIKPYYGVSAGNHLTALLRTHIMGAAEVLAAAKANDSSRLASAKKAWFDNADEISLFLSKANPKYWPLASMKTMMHDHLNLTLAEATDQLQGHYQMSVADYDRVQDEILKMADMLTTGIARQHPSKVVAVATR